MPRILEQLTPEGGIEVPRESLTSITQRNLKELEELGGFSFEDVAYKYPVIQAPHIRDSSTAVKVLPVLGTGLNGEDVSYVRRETAGVAAGQTLLFIDGKRHFMTKILRQLKGEE